MALPEKLIENAIIDIELLALSKGVSHDTAMNSILEIAKVADKHISELSYLLELQVGGDKEPEICGIEHNFYKAATIGFMITTTILGVYIACI